MQKGLWWECSADNSVPLSGEGEGPQEGPCSSEWDNIKLGELIWRKRDEEKKEREQDLENSIQTQEKNKHFSSSSSECYFCVWCCYCVIVVVVALLFLFILQWGWTVQGSYLDSGVQFLLSMWHLFTGMADRQCFSCWQCKTNSSFVFLLLTQTV